MKDIMTAAWRLASEGAERFGGKPRAFFAEALRMVWEENRQPVRTEIQIGRDGCILENLEYTNRVCAGGAITPSVMVHSDYAASRRQRASEENLSGSRRSGTISWQLEEDRLYTMLDVSVTASKSETRYVSTFDGITRKLTIQEFEAERRLRWPTGYELNQLKLAQARVEEEARQLRQIEIEKERLVRMRVEAERREAQMAEKRAALEAEATKIEQEGQPDTGLPMLTGSTKQIAYALKIREAVHRREPKNTKLRRSTRAAYWIENYRSALPRY